MSIYIGNNKYKEIYLGSTKISEVYLGSNKIFANTPVDPYNPLNLPQYTVRVKVKSGVTPTAPTYYTCSATLVDSTNNIWDLYLAQTSWGFDNSFFGAFGLGTGDSNTQVLEILGANTTGVTNMYKFCRSQTALTSVVPFDISSVTDARYMFAYCNNLTAVPAFNPTSSLTQTDRMFIECYKVETGALSLYNTMSTLNISSHSRTFRYCGRDTTTGAAELAQIPSNWK